VTWQTEAELDRLDAAFMDLPKDCSAMIMTEFDRFCAGLVTSLEMIAPSVWLSRGGDVVDLQPRAPVRLVAETTRNRIDV
jgi:hypothetical protein